MHTILLAASDRQEIDLLRAYLSKAFCRLVLAATLPETLDSAAREKPDVIITTFIDPGLGDATAPVPIILVTDAEHADLPMLRVASVLGRPVKEERFLAEVRRFVELPALREPRVVTSLSCIARIDRRDLPVRIIDLSSGGALIRAVFALPLQGAGFSLVIETRIDGQRERFT
ncbi:MAG TPA: hypothetical protein VHL58_19765, partial [Thermoanaerobaculia bacterium]|nr:hypothetical protein [Thermoanaerobaculia bacterium]